MTSGKSVECNCGQLDPHGIGIQCSRDLVERQENPAGGSHSFSSGLLSDPFVPVRS